MRLHDLFENSRQPLFHGTALLNALCIVYENKIRASHQYEMQPEGVSLTRDYRTAREFATYWERTYPTVLVLDQDKLRTKYKITPYRDFDPWGSPDETGWPARREGGAYRPKEQEEIITVPQIAPVSKYLLSINIDPAHLARAASHKEYLYWMFEEQENIMRAMKIRSRKELGRRIEAFAAHPLINQWTPKVSVIPGHEKHGWF